MIDVLIDSVYLGVVSLRGLRIIIFLAELNNMETWAADIGSMYLKSTTGEKVFIVTGPEFGELRNCTLVIESLVWTPKF